MKLVMIFSSTLPTERAHGVQIAKMCEAFADCGVDVELIISRKKLINDDIYKYYKVKNNFIITQKWCVNFNNNYRIRYFSFLLNLIFSRIRKDCYIFTRYPEVAFLFSLLGYKVVFENHNWREDKKHKNLFLIKNVFLVVATTKIIKNEYIINKFKEKKIIVSPHGVDVDQFNIQISKKEAREKLGIPFNKKIVLYSGHLYKQKGVYTIVEAAKQMSDEYLFIFVGGLEGDIKKLKKVADDCRNVNILGQKKPTEIPLYLKAADFLVIANSGKDEVERKYTAPLKLFEYLVSGRIILASDVPAIREFLNDETAIFFEPDNPQSLAQVIKGIDNDSEKQESIINNVRKIIKNLTWKNRAEKIIKSIELT
ncbi:MAG: glycosyltransferase [Patescibacteria group bacterium]